MFRRKYREHSNVQPASIYGTWELQYRDGELTHQTEYVFSSDGTGVERIRGTSDCKGLEVFPFNWHTGGDRFAMNYLSSNGPQISMMYRINGNRCTFIDPALPEATMELVKVET